MQIHQMSFSAALRSRGNTLSIVPLLRLGSVLRLRLLVVFACEKSNQNKRSNKVGFDQLDRRRRQADQIGWDADS